MMFRKEAGRHRRVRSQEPIPIIGPGDPPVIAGVAALADAVQHGLARQTFEQLLRRAPTTQAEKAAQLLDNCNA